MVGIKKHINVVYTFDFDIPRFLHLLFASCEMRKEETLEERVTKMNKNKNNKKDGQALLKPQSHCQKSRPTLSEALLLLLLLVLRICADDLSLILHNPGKT